MTTIRYDSTKPLDSEFILYYGEALLEWSYVENRLFRWFHHLTGMTERLARATFFSARSFAARAEMLAAVLDDAEFKGAAAVEAEEFIREAITKAIAYMGIRNALAHGMAIRWVDGYGATDLLVQGGAAVHMRHKTGLTVSHFRIVMSNFSGFANLTQAALRFYRGEQPQQLQECLAQLALLPNEPDKGKPSQKQLGRQRQQQSRLRGKSRKK